MPLLFPLLLSVLGGAALLFLLWLLAAAPSARRADPELFQEVLYAHRGLFDLSQGVAENSLAAFSLAAERGFGIELDVQLSSDGTPMIFHDKTLDRACGVSGRLCEKSERELAELSLFGIPDARIPTLAEVLTLVDGRVPLLVEIKEHPSPSAVSSAVAPLLDTYRGRYLVEAFHPLSLLWFRRHRPAVLRGQLSSAFLRNPKTRTPRYAILHFFLLNFLSRPDFIAYKLHDRASPVIRILRALFGVPLLGWTARTEAEYGAPGFDTLIFEGDISKKTKGTEHEA